MSSIWQLMIQLTHSFIIANTLEIIFEVIVPGFHVDDNTILFLTVAIFKKLNTLY